MQISRLLCEEHQGSKRMKHRARKPHKEMKKAPATSLNPSACRHCLRRCSFFKPFSGA